MRTDAGAGAGRGAIAIALALLLCASAGAVPAPDFALRADDARVVRLSEQRGRPVVLAFWSSRCGRCDAHLRALLDAFGGIAPEAVELWIVSIDRKPERSRALAERLGVTVLDDSARQVAASYELPRLPAVYLVDAHGQLDADAPGPRAPRPDAVRARALALLETNE